MPQWAIALTAGASFVGVFTLVLRAFLRPLHHGGEWEGED